MRNRRTVLEVTVLLVTMVLSFALGRWWSQGRREKRRAREEAERRRKEEAARNEAFEDAQGHDDGEL